MSLPRLELTKGVLKVDTKPARARLSRRSTGRSVGYVLAAIATLLSFAELAAANDRYLGLPLPISETELDSLLGGMRAGPEKRREIDEAYAEYLEGWKRLSDRRAAARTAVSNVFPTAEGGGDRRGAEDAHKQVRDLLRHIDLLDESFLVRCEGESTENQVTSLQRYRSRRACDRVRSVVSPLLAENKCVLLDLNALAEALDLAPQSLSVATEVLDAHAVELKPRLDALEAECLRLPLAIFAALEEGGFPQFDGRDRSTSTLKDREAALAAAWDAAIAPLMRTARSVAELSLRTFAELFSKLPNAIGMRLEAQVLRHAFLQAYAETTEFDAGTRLARGLSAAEREELSQTLSDLKIMRLAIVLEMLRCLVEDDESVMFQARSATRPRAEWDKRIAGWRERLRLVDISATEVAVAHTGRDFPAQPPRTAHRIPEPWQSEQIAFGHLRFRPSNTVLPIDSRMIRLIAVTLHLDDTAVLEQLHADYIEAFTVMHGGKLRQIRNSAERVRGAISRIALDWQNSPVTEAELDEMVRERKGLLSLPEKEDTAFMESCVALSADANADKWARSLRLLRERDVLRAGVAISPEFPGLRVSLESDLDLVRTALESTAGLDESASDLVYDYAVSAAVLERRRAELAIECVRALELSEAAFKALEMASRAGVVSGGEEWTELARAQHSADRARSTAIRLLRDSDRAIGELNRAAIPRFASAMAPRDRPRFRDAILRSVLPDLQEGADELLLREAILASDAMDASEREEMLSIVASYTSETELATAASLRALDVLTHGDSTWGVRMSNTIDSTDADLALLQESFNALKEAGKRLDRRAKDVLGATRWEAIASRCAQGNALEAR